MYVPSVGDRIKFAKHFKGQLYSDTRGVGVIAKVHVGLDLVSAIFKSGLTMCLFSNIEKAAPRAGKPHPLTKIFQEKMPSKSRPKSKGVKGYISLALK